MLGTNGSLRLVLLNGGLFDRDFDFARHFLDIEATVAYDLALEALGGPSYLEHSKVELLPIGEPDTLSSDFYRSWASDHPKMKLQKLFTKATGLRARDRFLNYQPDHLDLSQKVLLHSLQHSKPGDSLLFRLFTAPLTHRDTRLTKTSFVVAARQFLCLPPLKNRDGALNEKPCGCEIQLCSNPTCPQKNESLDAAGNHALLCHPGVKAQKATLLERTLEKAFRRSGGVPTRQPQTYHLCGGIFSKDDLSRLFPGGLNATEAKRRELLAMKYLDILDEVPRGSMRTGLIGDLRDLEFPPLVSSKDEDKNNTVRFDLRFPTLLPVDSPRELWIDHAIVQETSATYALDVLKFLDMKEENHPRDSPAIRKTFGAKLRRYSALKAIVERLSIDQKLDFQPELLFPVVSSLGYMNADMYQLIRFLVNNFAENLQHSPERQDGISRSVLRGRFSRDLHNSLCFALVRGNALAVANQGLKGVTTPV